MSQNLTFDKAVQKLYFNIDVKNTSVDIVINDFKNASNEHQVNKGTSSLSLNLNMGMDNSSSKASHIFKFDKSPLPDMSVDSGFVKVDIGEAGGVTKIVNVDWCFYFLNKTDAETFFENLVKIFMPISTLHNVEDDELNSGKYAEFSTRDSHVTGIKDITFIFGRSVDANKYELRIIPYNGFVE
jgi:hypothetical protein